VLIFVLEESIHDVHSVVTAQLQQDPCVIIYISITMFANHTLPYPRSVPNVCMEVSQKDRGFVRFSILQRITSFFHELPLKYVCVLGVYLYQTQEVV